MCVAYKPLFVHDVTVWVCLCWSTKRETELVVNKLKFSPYSPTSSLSCSESWKGRHVSLERLCIQTCPRSWYGTELITCHWHNQTATCKAHSALCFGIAHWKRWTLAQNLRSVQQMEYLDCDVISIHDCFCFVFSVCMYHFTLLHVEIAFRKYCLHCKTCYSVNLLIIAHSVSLCCVMLLLSLPLLKKTNV